jgi:hypothetical protein
MRLKAKMAITMTRVSSSRKAPHAVLELVFRRAQAQALGYPPELRVPADPDHQRPRRAAHHVRTHEQAVGPPGQGRVGCQLAQGFEGREAFPGQSRLVHAQVLGLQEQAVPGRRAAGRQQHHVPGCHLLGRNLRLGAVPQYANADPHHVQEPIHRPRSAPFLPEAQQAAHQDDGQHDNRIQRVAQEKGQPGGHDQQQDDGALELGQEQPQSPGFAAAPQPPRAGQAAKRFRTGQPFRGAAQVIEDFLRRVTPEGFHSRFRSLSYLMTAGYPPQMIILDYRPNRVIWA